MSQKLRVALENFITHGVDDLALEFEAVKTMSSGNKQHSNSLTDYPQSAANPDAELYS